MTNRFFREKLAKNLPYTPTEDQNIALDLLVDFLFDFNSEKVFILKGYAGTGKSSMIGSLVKVMMGLKQKCILLAPTGRAAKVFSQYAGSPASTIHKKIYRQKRFSDEEASFSLLENMYKNTLFIVDEASMVNASYNSNSCFGSGSLLEDLLSYVYSGDGCSMLLLGDTAQLPPVSEPFSVALDPKFYPFREESIYEYTLTEIVRQSELSGILVNATLIRDAIASALTSSFPKLRVNCFPEVQTVAGDELIEAIGSAYSSEGVEETMIISRSNKRVKIYNEGVRNRVLYREEEISSGDILMVNKNNYFWTKDFPDMTFLANGEMLEVVRVRRSEEMHSYRFCDVTLRHPDYDIEFDAKINLNFLHAETPSQIYEMNNNLFSSVMEDYADIPLKRNRYKKVKEDHFYNALQVKYGYAVTCHKAQGSEWCNVFLDLGYVTKEHMDDGFYRWLYTAITRATQRLYFVNLHENFIDDSI